VPRGRIDPPCGLCPITRPTIRDRWRLTLPTRQRALAILARARRSVSPITRGTRQRAGGFGNGGGGTCGGGGGGGGGG